MADPILNLANALRVALRYDPDRALGVIPDVMSEFGKRALLVEVNDLDPAPLVATTIQAKDVTAPMVAGLVRTLLERAGVQPASAALQANIAGNFVANYVRKQGIR